MISESEIVISYVAETLARSSLSANCFATAFLSKPKNSSRVIVAV